MSTFAPVMPRLGERAGLAVASTSGRAAPSHAAHRMARAPAGARDLELRTTADRPSFVRRTALSSNASSRASLAGVAQALAYPAEAQGAAVPAQPPPEARETSAAASAPLAYELVQGPLVRWCLPDSRSPPPTAVFVHGILGSRRNLLSFAKRVVEACPSWQVLLVDLRCHGESAAAAATAALAGAPHSVEGAAADVLGLLKQLRLFPHVLVGHSFGGKVVLSMAEQFGRKTVSLPRPVQVWVLDALPGEVRAGGGLDGSDSPSALIDMLRALPTPLPDRSYVVNACVAAGFSPDIARWVTTNLRPAAGGGLEWTFDLNGIAQLYASYETTHLWGLLAAPPAGLKIDFVKAEHSNFRWHEEVESRITAHGHGVHLLHNSGHWVHTDQPDGLLRILAPSFGQLAA